MSFHRAVEGRQCGTATARSSCNFVITGLVPVISIRKRRAVASGWPGQARPRQRKGSIHLRERLREIRDDVVWMLDADREADRRVGDADAVAHLLRHPGMRRRGRVRGKRFGAAEADRELEDAQRVEEAEGLGLAALDVEREGRAGGGALRR